jgi:2-phospho-L-lactate/phosphoenolpyruvate guanylyltransferase
MLYILIPCKPLHEGKSRLGDVLSDEDRYALCRRLLRSSLTLALELQYAAGVRILTSDPEASDLAAAHGVPTIDDGGAGLNEALRQARVGLLDATGGAATTLILPIDLPYATADAVGRALEGAGDVVIAPDGERRGTNLLYLGPRAMRAFSFAFGPDSFTAHWDGALHAGLDVEILEDERLAFDLDRAEHYHWWLQNAG